MTRRKKAICPVCDGCGEAPSLPTPEGVVIDECYHCDGSGEVDNNKASDYDALKARLAHAHRQATKLARRAYMADVQNKSPQFKKDNCDDCNTPGVWESMYAELQALKTERDLLLAVKDRFVACFEPGDRKAIVSANFDAVWEAIDAWKRQQEPDK